MDGQFLSHELHEKGVQWKTICRVRLNAILFEFPGANGTKFYGY